MDNAIMRNIHFLEETRLEARDALATIIHAYDAAGQPPIPTPLLAAIEHARKVIG